jgi:hypothetical protein
MSKRYLFFCLVVGATWSPIACGGSTDEGSEVASPDAGSSAPQPVSVDFQVPSSEDYRAELTGAAQGELTGRGASVTFRRETDEIALSLAGSKFNLSANYALEEGETGTFASIKTPQIVYEGTRYVAKDAPVVVTIDTFSDGTFEGALVGTFGYTRSSGSDQQLDEPVTLRAKMSFEYSRRQPPMP